MHVLPSIDESDETTNGKMYEHEKIVLLLHFISRCSNCNRQELVPETDAEYWFVIRFIQHPFDVSDCLATGLWVSRTVTQEQTVIFYKVDAKPSLV